MNEPGPKFFRGFTLVDITPTGVLHSSPTNELERNQQRNWETILQCIGLRTQPFNISQPELMVGIDGGNIVNMGFTDFGDLYTGRHKVWTWKWSVEASDIYALNGKPLAGLYNDFENIPVITCLTETARFILPVLHPYGSIKNIYFKQ